MLLKHCYSSRVLLVHAVIEALDLKKESLMCPWSVYYGGANVATPSQCCAPQNAGRYLSPILALRLSIPSLGPVCKSKLKRRTW